MDRSDPPGINSGPTDRAGLRYIFRQGVLTNVLNPKVALFFLAFLPQFISVSSPNKVLSFIVLGAIFITTGTVWCVIVAVFASGIGARLRGPGKSAGWLKKVNGTLFVLLGLKLATSRFGS